MQLVVKPFKKNTFPLEGILIRHASPSHWIKEIQLLGLTLQTAKVYPIPDVTANAVWGCLVVSDQLKTAPLHKHEKCQLVASTLFIPERSIIQPLLTNEEIVKIFASKKHLFHPSVGLFELEQPADWSAIITLPAENQLNITPPKPSINLPYKIKSFRIQTLPPEEVLKNLEENVFPKSKKLDDKPLNIFEKVKLRAYKWLFSKNKNKENATERTEFAEGIFSFLKPLFKQVDNWADNMQQDFEDLEKRNQKNIDKLLEMLKKNPEEALMYAIPLDDKGTSRGQAVARLDLSKKWFDWSLFGHQRSNAGGGRIEIGNHFYTLQKQYNETAEALIKDNEHQKAAFVYMKLLKNYYKAAETMEAGKYYQEAATIYLKHCNNKLMAAQCFEKGSMTSDAIKLYAELNENEKVGDLYRSIHEKDSADVYYQKVVDDYKTKSQYLKASFILRKKMEDTDKAQEVLMEGWRLNKDSINCLNNYFANIEDTKKLSDAINSIYSSEVNPQNSEAFLKVIQLEYQKQNELSDSIREMAYQIVSAQIANNPAIVLDLKAFNPGDKELLKDTLRFKLSRKM